MKERQPDKDFTRQLDWFNPATDNVPITIVGAGGIGGPTALAIAKLGIRKIKVYDFDLVEAHNQPNQMYGLNQLQESKVAALHTICRDLADIEIIPMDKRVTRKTPLSGIVIGAVDSMDARRIIWEAICSSGGLVPLYIDGRIGGQVIRVLTVRPDVLRDRKAYTKSIVSTHAAAPLRCTAAGIIDVSFAVASLITRALRLWITKKERIADLVYDQRNLMVYKH